MFRIVCKGNAPWPSSTWFDCADGYCQKVYPQTDNGRVVSYCTEGPLIPVRLVLPYTVGVMKTGLDIGGERKG